MRTKSISVGGVAPDFTLKNQRSETVTLSQYCGDKWVVLFFYPKNFTPGCTTEVCTFRDSYAVFQEAGAEVLGISSDDTASHEKFSGEHRLPFQLLSDPGEKIRKLYGVPKTLGLLPGRVTYVIDPKGTVQKIFSSQFNAEAHVREALAVLRGEKVSNELS